MIPPRSPYSLIQEDYWPDSFKILVVCMLLNCTTRRAVERVAPRLFDRYPDAQSMANASPEEMKSLIRPLGFGNRRTHNLLEMSRRYISDTWTHPRELPGVGDYAAAAWDIFILRNIPPRPPKDHALTLWWKWNERHRGICKE